MNEAPHTAMLKSIAARCLERQEALNLKGKKAEVAALEFFAGAATSLRLADHPAADHVEMCVTWLLPTSPFPLGTIAGWATGMRGRDHKPGLSDG